MPPLRPGIDFTISLMRGQTTTFQPMPWPAACPACGIEWTGIQIINGEDGAPIANMPFEEGNQFACMTCEVPFIVDKDGFRRLTDDEIRECLARYKL